jgi:CRISPR system Cascade subunit CasE
MSALYLSRARLRAARGEVLSAVAPLLVPDDSRHRAGHAHRVLWLLFQDRTDAKRDFLWRDEGNGRYLVLSHRPPVDPNGLFDIETKAFEPHLEPGDKLSFALRANPVAARKGALTQSERECRARGKRVDVVMDALHAVPKGQRAAVRDGIAAKAGESWLARQGEVSGFRLARPPTIDGYAQIPVERRKGRPAGFSVLDLAGEIEITDPPAFLARLAKGFGSAKAFGNGLMLIRRT